MALDRQHVCFFVIQNIFTPVLNMHFLHILSPLPPPILFNRNTARLHLPSIWCNHRITVAFLLDKSHFECSHYGFLCIFSNSHFPNSDKTAPLWIFLFGYNLDNWKATVVRMHFFRFAHVLQTQLLGLYSLNKMFAYTFNLCTFLVHKNECGTSQTF